MKSLCIGAVTCVLVLSSGTAQATTPQQRDKLGYGDRDYVIWQVPMLGLWYYGDGDPPPGKKPPPNFDFESSANWGGYSAHWEIRNKQLFLRSITGKIKGKKVKNEAILANQKFPLQADWYTGRIELPVGSFDEDRQEHESIIVFEIEKGIVKSTSFMASGKLKGTWDGL